MKRVQDALKSTGIPAFAGAWKATAENPTAPEQYLVYTTQTYETEHWDDALRRYEVYVYLNLWCAGDPTDAIRRVRAASITAFSPPSTAPEQYSTQSISFLFSKSARD